MKCRLNLSDFSVRVIGFVRLENSNVFVLELIKYFKRFYYLYFHIYKMTNT